MLYHFHLSTSLVCESRFLLGTGYSVLGIIEFGISDTDTRNANAFIHASSHSIKLSTPSPLLQI